MRTQDLTPPCGQDPTFDFEAVAQLPEAVKLEQNGTPKLCEAVLSQLLRAGRPLDRSGDRWEGHWSTPMVKIGRLGAAGGQNGQNLPGQVLRLPEPPNR